MGLTDAVQCTCIIIAVCLVRAALAHSDTSLLLLVSFDGFRWDYLDVVKQKGGQVPNFDDLIESGVKAEYVEPRFVSSTFPNHYSIATGMYETNHGVVHNIMYDPVLNQTFDVSNTDSVWFNNASTNPQIGGPEPIWITNQKGPQTILGKRRSGVYFWPGSESEIHGQRPHHFRVYNRSVPNRKRIDTVIDWFSNDSAPINLGLIYFSEPDHTGHDVGPDSEDMFVLIQELDKLVGYLVKQLKSHNLFHRLNLVITSDHGMTAVAKGNVIVLEDYLDLSLADVYGSPVANVWPKAGYEEAVYSALRSIPHLHVYKKADIPEEYHYTFNHRILPIVIAAEEGYVIFTTHARADNSHYMQRAGGLHGYNNSLTNMRPFFIAHGPAFKEGYISEPFRNIDIYGVMCDVLQLEPAPNDGSMEVVAKMLRYHHPEGEVHGWTITIIVIYGLIGVCGGSITLLFMVTACRHAKKKKSKKGGLPVVLDSFSDGHTALLAASDDEEDIP